MANIACQARFAADWDQVRQLGDEIAKNATIDSELALGRCLQADAALFGNNDTLYSKTLYMKALALEDQLVDARFRLASLTLFDDGCFSLDEFGRYPASLSIVPVNLVEDALKMLIPLIIPDKPFSLPPYQYLLLVQALTLRAILRERIGLLADAQTDYSETYQKLVTPLVIVNGKPPDKPKLSVSTDAIYTQIISNVLVALIVGRCRSMIKMANFERFLNCMRQFIRSPIGPPRVVLVLQQRFADMLVFHNLSIYHLYSSHKRENNETPFRSPLEESLLLVALALDRILPSDRDSDLGLSLRRTARLILSISDQFAAIGDLHRDDLALDLSNHDLFFFRALSLYCSYQYSESYLAAKTCLALSPDHIDRTLFAAKLCLNHLSNPSQALQFAQKARDLCHSEHPLRPICDFVISTASGRYAYEVWTFSKRKALQQGALKASLQAAKASPKNQRFIFSIAIIQADIREIDIALQLTRLSLSLNASHFASWQLLALLLSSQKKFDDAVQVCDVGLGEFPSSLGRDLLFLRAHILTTQLTSENLLPAEQSPILTRALETYRQLLGKLLPDSSLGLSDIGPFTFPTLIRATTEGKEELLGAIQQMLGFSQSTRFVGMLVSNSFKNDDPLALVYRTILSLIDLYQFAIRVFDLSDLTQLSLTYIEFATDLGSSSWLPDVYTRLGRITEQTGDLTAAIGHYESALAFDGNHTDALIDMGALQIKMDKAVIAHENLINALHIDSSLHSAWLEIGVILHGQGMFDTASDAVLTALELERTSPADSFSTIRRTV